MKNIYVLPTDKPSRLFYLASNLHLEQGQLISPKNYQNIYITSDEEIKEGDWVFNFEYNYIVRYDSKKHDNKFWYKKIILTIDLELIKNGVQSIPDDFLEWFVKNPSCEFVETKRIIKEYVDDQDAYGYDVNYYKIIIPKEEVCSLCEKNVLIDGICKECTKLICKPFSVIEKQEPKQEYDIKELNRLDDIEIEEMSNDWETMSQQIKPKQETTLEEAAENYISKFYTTYAFKGLLKNLFIDAVKYQQEQDKNKYSEEEVEPLLSFIRDIKDNWDCDNDAHKYGTICRCCDAEKTLEQFKKK